MKSYGHGWGEIQGYTLGQMLIFLREGMELERQRLKHGAIASRAAYHADGDAWRSFIDD